MGKFGKKVEIQLNPLNYNCCLAGESGIGKSTLIKEMCEKLAGDDGYLALDIGREDGHSAINGIVSEQIEDWAKFVEVTDDIIENKEEEYPNLKVIIIDTYDEFCNIAEKEIIRQHNRKNPDKRTDTINGAFGGFGKGLDKTIDLMLDKLWELKKVGVSFIIVAHVRKKDIDDVMTQEQYSVLTSNVSQRYFNAIKTKLHFLGLAYIDREIVKEKTGKKNVVSGVDILKGQIVSESRIINFRDDTYSIDSKSRFANIVNRIPFDSDELIKAMTDAILAEHNKSGESIEVTKEKQDKEAKEAEKVAAEYSKARKKNKIDEEKNEGLIAIIQEKFTDASVEIKTEAKAIMTEYGFAKFSEDNIPTEALERIVEILNKAA